MKGLLWLVLLVVLIVLLVAYLNRRSSLKAQPSPPPPAESGLNADDISQALSDLLGSMIGTVPLDVITKYQSIHR